MICGWDDMIREKVKTWTFVAVIISLLIGIYFFGFVSYPCSIVKGAINQNITCIKEHSEFIRNFLMGLVPLIGFPIIVWGAETACKQAKIAAEQKETAKKSLQETENNNRRTQENKIYMDCVGHLSSDKETIRTASIHGFGELLENLENEIKNLNETEIRKQERINFQDKILNVLWSFMVEHSREVLRLDNKVQSLLPEHDKSNVYKYDYDKDEISLSKFTENYLDQLSQLNSSIQRIKNSYYPQFRFIMELLAKYRPHTYALGKFWQNKFWKNIYLQSIYLGEAELSGADLVGANLNGADLSGVDLSGADLRGVNLSGAILKRAFFSKGFNAGFSSKAFLREEDLSEANLSGAKFNNATIFPDGFDREIDTKKHKMINLDEPTEQEKQQTESPVVAE